MLRPDTFALTALLALLTALGPLSTDMYLPSLPVIGADFGAPTSQVQLTLSAFLLGFAAGQILYGPLADRYGRKPPLLGGLGLFIVASALCAVAPTIETLIAARFLQAFGASGPIVLARAIVRDLYDGPRAGRELSRMGTIMGLVPAAAPILGAAIELVAGWRLTFWITLLCGIAAAVVCYARLPETIRAKNPAPISPIGILRGYADLLSHGGYVAYAALLALTYGGLFSWISGSSFVLQGVYHLSAMAFGFAFTAGVAGYITGTVLAQRLVPRLGIERTLARGCLCLVFAGPLMLAGVLSGTSNPVMVIAPMALYLCGVGLVMPQAMAGALMPFAHKAGAASSLSGFIQMLTGAAIGAAVGHGLGAGAALPLPIAVTLTGSAAFLVFHLTKAIRVPAPALSSR